MTLGPTVRDGEHVFGVAHIFASFNDTFIVSIKAFAFLLFPISSPKPGNVCLSFQLQHVTDLSGRETLVRITGEGQFYFKG